MLNFLDLEKLYSQFVFDQYDPLLIISSFFLFFFLVILAIYKTVSFSSIMRSSVLLLTSVFFYYKVSGIFIFLLIFSSFSNYLLGLWINIAHEKLKRIILIIGIILNLGALFIFKYYNFFANEANTMFLSNFPIMEFAFAIGISFYTFKAISYLVDVYWEKYDAEKNILDFSVYMMYFLNVTAGPIDRADQFLTQLKSKYNIDSKTFNTAIFLIILGLVKKGIVADYLSVNYVDVVFSGPYKFTGVENLIAVYAFTLQIFLDFSGYTDIVRGLSLLLGINLMENFNSPYRATSITDFWRRWHISLSKWLQDYLFKPIQIKFRNFKIFSNVIAITITFVLCGLWHGASWNFLIWGALHAFFMVFGVLTKSSKEKVYRKLGILNKGWLIFLQRFITFNLIAFAWIFFRASDFQNAMDIITQIVYFLNAQILPQFITTYPYLVFFLIAGYLFHFIPERYYELIKNSFSVSPYVLKILIFALTIWLIAQIRFADTQLFFYFQY